MKKRNIKFLSVIIILCLIFFYYYNYSYVVFKPLLFDKTFEKQETFEPDNAFYQRLALALKKHNFKYKVDESGKVLVPRSFSRNNDMRYNFTKKSMDSNWIKQHPNPADF